MGVIRNTASMQIRGRVGNTTYYVEGGRQIARVSQNGSNYGESASRSEKQQFQRGKWGNLVNFYKVSKAWMPKAYESKKRTQSDYNRFMQLNTPNARIYLTRNMYANGGCVADAYRISEGSLRPISVVSVKDSYRTDISLGPDLTVMTSTVARFSEALIEANNFLHAGMQISFISYQQQLTPDGVPSLICTAYEVTLDVNNTDNVRDYLPEFCCEEVDGFLGTTDQISTGAFAYVLSETVNGKTSVSTQTLITKNESLIAEFSSADAIAASIASYGVDKDIFLTSGSNPTNPTPQPVYIAGLRYGVGTANERFVAPGEYMRIASELFTQGGDVILDISGRFTTATNGTILSEDGAYHGINMAKTASGDLKLTLSSGVAFTSVIKKIMVILDGAAFEIEFLTEID